jgi:ATP-dependent helicase/nuclease subunit B
VAVRELFSRGTFSAGLIMSVRFVVGRSGSGKTRRCLQSIAEELRARPLGEPIFWILPRQATFQAERDLACYPGLGGYARARVVSFETLGEVVLESTGGPSAGQITRLGRQMILGHLLRRHEAELLHFKSVARQPGLAARLDATFSEIERAGKGAGDLQAVIHEMEESARVDADGVALLGKMRDLHRLYEAYGAYLGQERLDPRRRMDQALAAIETCTLLPSATLYVDAFITFSEEEQKALASVAKVCRHLEIMLLMDPHSPLLGDPHRLPEELGLFYQTEETYRRLWFAFQEAGVTVQEAVRLEKTERFQHDTLKKLEEQWAAGSVAPARDEEGAVRLIEAADRRAEVDAAARTVQDWVRGGMRLRDIALLCRDLEGYQDLIEASFGEHGIAWFIDRRRTAMHHPLLQLIRALFQIARQDWPNDAAMALLKSGLAGITLEEADEIENYVLMHRIRGKAWASREPWAFVRAMRRGEEEVDVTAEERAGAQRVDALRRRVVEAVLPFIVAVNQPQRPGVNAMAAALFALLERLGVRRTLGEWMQAAELAQAHELREEHAQVWREVVGLFEQMVDLLGEEPLGLDDFISVLETGLEQFDLALIPPAIDQVLVGQVDRTRTPAVRGVIVLGMNEGEFPRLPREDTILSDRDRRALRERHVHVDPETQRRLLDENLLGYLALTRASEKLCLTRPAADESRRATAPSPFWNRLRQIVPQAPLEVLAREMTHAPQRIGTPRQLVTGLMDWVREGKVGSGQWQAGSEDNPGAWAGVYQWFVGCCGDGGRVDQMRRQAWGALSYRNDAGLSPEVAGLLFPSPLPAGVGQVETFATCPFKHYVRYGLGLRQREVQEVTQQDLSRLYHEILQRLVRELLVQRKDWSQLSAEVTDELIGQYAREVGTALKSELMLSNGRNQYLLGRIEKTLEQVVAHERAAAARGSFRPAFAEVTFGEGGRLPAYCVTTPAGRELRLHGKIDRVDTIAQQGTFAILDYKLTGSTLALDRVYHGISLQLLTYLLVLEANGQALAGQNLTPAAAFYLQLLRRLEEVRHPSEALEPEDPRFELKIKPRGIFDGQYLPALDAELVSGKSDVVNAHINKDGSFGFRNSSDVSDSEQFAGLLHHVRKTIGKLADRMLAGDIAIAPYRIHRLSPCPQCEFRSVCRFDPAINSYHHLPGMKREEVLEVVRMREEG